jgi:Bacterial cellulose synthase subunit
MALILTASACLHASNALANRVEIPIAPSAIKLGLLEQQRHLVIHADRPEERLSDPVLTIHWIPDSDLDLNASSVTIELDGRELQRVELAKNPSNSIAITLHKLEAGMHRVTVRGTLKSSQYSCSSQATAGLTLQAKSNLSWTRKDHSVPPSPLALYPNAWPRSASAVSDIELVVHATAASDKHMGGAFLDADHLLRSWGFRPVDRSTSDTVGQFTIALFEPHKAASSSLAIHANASEQRWQHAHQSLHRETKLGYVAFADEARNVVVIGRDVEGLRRGLHMLALEHRRSLCVDLFCLGTQRPDPTTLRQHLIQDTALRDDTTPPTRSVAEDPTRVLTLAERGHPKGWAARHFGVHRLSFVWQRPMHWRITADPTLAIKGDVSQAGHVDAKRSSIAISINGKPVATYSLERWVGSKTALRVPRDLWLESEWVITAEVELIPSDDTPCKVMNQGSAWLTIDADTALFVPREEALYSGIASLVSRFVDEGLPTVEISTEGNTLAHLRTVASSMYALQRATAWAPKVMDAVKARGAEESYWPVWRVAKSADECLSLQGCIRISARPPRASLLQWVDGYWQSDELTPSMPRVRAHGHPALIVLDQPNAGPTELHLLTGINILSAGDVEAQMKPLMNLAQLQETLAPWGADAPDPTGLLGRVAVFANRWHILDLHSANVMKQVGAKTRPAPERTSMSAEQSKVRLINFGWAALSLLILGLVALSVWRTPKGMKVNDQWEVHPSDDQPH